MRKISVAAVGDVSSPGTFSGTPFHFWATARSMGLDLIPWTMNLSGVGSRRKIWNLQQILRLRRPGGFQYSDSFARMVMKQIPDNLLSSDVISFNQHFPPANEIVNRGGRMFHYIDATFSQLVDRYNVGATIDKTTVAEIKAKEKDFFAQATHIFTMQEWARQSVINDYNIEPSKVTAVLPGANILFPDGYNAREKTERKLDKEHPLVLGFVGKDWKRKGLTILADVGDELRRRGHHVIVRCAGYAPDDFQKREGVEFAGFIDKNKNYSAFIDFIESCDIGCLFSEAEFSSISVLEFISAGRPVAGFVVDGMGDLFIPEVSLRFATGDTIRSIADRFEQYITDSSYQESLKASAVRVSQHVRWNRSVTEIMKVVSR